MNVKAKMGKRVLSFMLALLCFISVVPTTAFAADGVPDRVVLESATFTGNYSSASFSGSVGIHKMTMNMGSLGNHVSFCAEHGKGMSVNCAGQPWTNPQPVNNDVITLMMGYYYTHEEAIYNDECIAKGFNWTWNGNDQYSMFMNAWVQAVCWRALGQGAAIGGNVAEAIATELMYVVNAYSGSHDTDIYTETVERTPNTYMDVATSIVDNPGAWCDVDVYQYGYAGGDVGSRPASSIQAMLVGVPKQPDGEEYEITVKKVDATNPALGLAGATFEISKTDGSYTATGVTGQDGTYTFTRLTAGTYAITETDAPPGYQIDTPEPQYVSVPQTNEAVVVFTDTPPSTANGSIRKVDADNPTVGLAGATIQITGIGNSFGVQSFQTGEGGALISHLTNKTGGL